MKPFVKWVGGKTQLLDEIRDKYPDRIDRYCEPFVGGGAVLFDVLERFSPGEVLINDINRELTCTYKYIRDYPDQVLDILGRYETLYHNCGSDRQKVQSLYYDIRRDYNIAIANRRKDAFVAAMFIFLNKTCFNGLYRCNKKGFFNVPAGSYKNPLICDEETVRKASKLLSNVEIMCGDYSKTEAFVDSNTFVYIDPPYRPISKTSSFTSYAGNVFADDEQVALKDFAERCHLKGAKVLISNSDPKNSDSNDNFFDNLYCLYNISRVKASRALNCKSDGRGAVSELLICNY